MMIVFYPLAVCELIAELNLRMERHGTIKQKNGKN